LASKLENSEASCSTVPCAIEGVLVSSLTNKIGLMMPSMTGYIAGALPGLLQKLFPNSQDRVY